MKDYPPGTCVARSRSIKSCRGLAQCSYYRHMSAADHATVGSVHTVHSTPHDLMCLHWHCPVACGDIRQCRTCCCRGQDNNGWLLLSCHLLSANALYSIYNLHNSINTTSHDTSLGGPVGAEPLPYIISNCMVLSCAM